MNTKLFFRLNLVGVVAIAGLCAYQWYGEARLHGRLREANKEISVLKESLAERDGTITGLFADVVFFKEQFAAMKNEAEDARVNLRKAEELNARFAKDFEVFAANEKTFREAIKQRDAVLAGAEEKLKVLSGETNGAIQKYNDLAGKYNGVVEELNAARKALAQAYADLDEARKQLYRATGRPLPEEK